MPERQDSADMTAKPFHPLADLLPLLQGAEFDRLVADIAEQGLLNAITLYQGQILDGRNRERACRAAAILGSCSSGKDVRGLADELWTKRARCGACGTDYGNAHGRKEMASHSGRPSVGL
jgi:hypothetical protein